MNKLFRYAIYDNKWLWFHILAGGVLAKLVMLFNCGQQLAVIIVLLLAVGWEILEYISNDVGQIYGSKERFFLDAFGDIFGAFLSAILVVL